MICHRLFLLNLFLLNSFIVTKFSLAKSIGQRKKDFSEALPEEIFEDVVKRMSKDTSKVKIKEENEDATDKITEEAEVRHKSFHDENKLHQNERSTAKTKETEVRNNQDFKLILRDEKLENVTKPFRPSVHLGEIEEPHQRSNPFNNVQHIGFDGALVVGSSFPVNIQDVQQHTGITESLIGSNFPVSFPGISTNDEQSGNQQSGRIKFQDDPKSDLNLQEPKTHFQNYQSQPSGLDQHQNAYFHSLQGIKNSNYNELHPKQTPFDSQIFHGDILYDQNHETDSLSHSKTREHGNGGLVGLDLSKIPYLITGYYQNPEHDNHHHAQTSKQSGAVLYLPHQEDSHFLRNQKFAQNYYPSSVHEFVFVEEPRLPQHHLPKKQRISPWKKIIHLIGAFLPLGLLLATLTPNVLQIDNTTQPNIVLSKYRVDDRVEHKRARQVDDDRIDVCEERSICEMILAGGKPQSNLLQNILWNLATRSNEEAVKKSELQEVFEAVKKKDCKKINC